MNDTCTNKLIVIEGLDGSGKATQTDLLTENLKELNHIIRKVSFPVYESSSSALVKMYLAGEFGDKPDDVNAFAASSFYAVDRYSSYKKDWQNDYNLGIVVADRYTTSNAIHQCAKLDRSLWDEYLDWLFDYEYSMLEIPAPDIVIYLQVDPAVSQRLIRERYHGVDKRDIHEKNLEYLIRCQEAAAYCSQKLNWDIIQCCNGSEMRTIEEIQTEILTKVLEAI